MMMKYSTLICFIARANFLQFAREMSVLQQAARKEVQNNIQQTLNWITPVSTFKKISIHYQVILHQSTVCIHGPKKIPDKGRLLINHAKFQTGSAKYV
jgi:hypothetical protein